MLHVAVATTSPQEDRPDYYSKQNRKKIRHQLVPKHTRSRLCMGHGSCVHALRVGRASPNASGAQACTRDARAATDNASFPAVPARIRARARGKGPIFKPVEAVEGATTSPKGREPLPGWGRRTKAQEPRRAGANGARHARTRTELDDLRRHQRALAGARHTPAHTHTSERASERANRDKTVRQILLRGAALPRTRPTVSHVPPHATFPSVGSRCSIVGTTEAD